MTNETKIYSDFIKRNNIAVGLDYFTFNNQQVALNKDNGMWYAEQDDKCYTKKAAIYYYLKNRLNVIDGIIQDK